MNKELMKTVSESLIRLRFLVGSQFVKPIKEIERERTGLPPGYIHIMGWIKSKETPVSMTDLAQKAFISKPNLTTMVDRLCDEGMVERLADPNDRRIVNVGLTQKGIDYLNQHKAEIMEFIVNRLSLLDDPDLERLKNSLDEIADILSIMEDKKKGKL